eukprot:COSAG02_NODE_570_length_20203_cov_8.049990_8_plen_507_part_00
MSSSLPRGTERLWVGDRVLVDFDALGVFEGVVQTAHSADSVKEPAVVFFECDGSICEVWIGQTHYQKVVPSAGDPPEDDALEDAEYHEDGSDPPEDDALEDAEYHEDGSTRWSAATTERRYHKFLAHLESFEGRDPTPLGRRASAAPAGLRVAGSLQRDWEGNMRSGLPKIPASLKERTEKSGLLMPQDEVEAVAFAAHLDSFEGRDPTPLGRRLSAAPAGLRVAGRQQRTWEAGVRSGNTKSPTSLKERTEKSGLLMPQDEVEAVVFAAHLDSFEGRDPTPLGRRLSAAPAGLRVAGRQQRTWEGNMRSGNNKIPARLKERTEKSGLLWTPAEVHAEKMKLQPEKQKKQKLQPQVVDVMTDLEEQGCRDGPASAGTSKPKHSAYWYQQNGPENSWLIKESRQLTREQLAQSVGYDLALDGDINRDTFWDNFDSMVETALAQPVPTLSCRECPAAATYGLPGEKLAGATYCKKCAAKWAPQFVNLDIARSVEGVCHSLIAEALEME